MAEKKFDSVIVSGQFTQEEQIVAATRNFRDFLSGSLAARATPEATYIDAYTDLISACGGDEERATAIINDLTGA